MIEGLKNIPRSVTRFALVSALAAGYGLLLNPQDVHADELGKQIAQAGSVRALDKNITGAEALRLPIEAPAPINITPAPQVDIQRLIPTAIVEMGRD